MVFVLSWRVGMSSSNLMSQAEYLQTIYEKAVRWYQSLSIANIKVD